MGTAGAVTEFVIKFTAHCYDEAMIKADGICCAWWLCCTWFEGYSLEEFEDFVTELDFSVEIYSPEKHDMNLN